MNDETPNEENVEPATVEELTEAFVVAREQILEEDGDVTAGMLVALQDEVDELRAALVTSGVRVTELETERDTAPPLAAPIGDHSLRALAATVRQCQRNGHPDLATHLDTLLTALGAL